MPTPRCGRRRRLRLVSVELVAEAPPPSPGTLHGPETAAAFLQQFIGNRDREHFVVLHLNAKHRVVSCEVVSVGSVCTAIVHPREVFKAAILSNAQSIICAHNHPSGDLEPSSEDRAILRRLNEVGELIGIRLLDFLVVSATGFRSLSNELRSNFEG